MLHFRFDPNFLNQSCNDTMKSWWTATFLDFFTVIPLFPWLSLLHYFVSSSTSYPMSVFQTLIYMLITQLIYYSFNILSDSSDKLNVPYDLGNIIQSLVNWSKKYLLIFTASQTKLQTNFGESFCLPSAWMMTTSDSVTHWDLSVTCSLLMWRWMILLKQKLWWLSEILLQCALSLESTMHDYKSTIKYCRRIFSVILVSNFLITLQNIPKKGL